MWETIIPMIVGAGILFIGVVVGNALGAVREDKTNEQRTRVL